MAVKDIMLDDNADLLIQNGDFVISESDAQHIMLIINLMEGSIKQFPLQGVGIMQYSGSSGQGANLKKQIGIKLDADGYTNPIIQLEQNANGVFEFDVTADRT